mmetsp:Transcript_7724/g.22694  ORF Transcript_7724/g.22694 Transcript_7724/m.22694 type:complete len:178 (-) Transcript_7724:79-612(-)
MLLLGESSVAYVWTPEEHALTGEEFMEVFNRRYAATAAVDEEEEKSDSTTAGRDDVDGGGGEAGRPEEDEGEEHAHIDREEDARGAEQPDDKPVEYGVGRQRGGGVIAVREELLSRRLRATGVTLGPAFSREADAEVDAEAAAPTAAASNSLATGAVSARPASDPSSQTRDLSTGRP